MKNMLNKIKVLVLEFLNKFKTVDTTKAAIIKKVANEQKFIVNDIKLSDVSNDDIIESPSINFEKIKNIVNKYPFNNAILVPNIVRGTGVMSALKDSLAEKNISFEIIDCALINDIDFVVQCLTIISKDVVIIFDEIDRTPLCALDKLFEFIISRKNSIMLSGKGENEIAYFPNKQVI